MRMLALAMILLTVVASPAHADFAPDPKANKQLLLDLNAQILKGGKWKGKSPDKQPCTLAVTWRLEDGNPILNMHTTVKTPKTIEHVYAARVEDVLSFEDRTMEGEPLRLYEVKRTRKVKETEFVHYHYYIQSDLKGALDALLVDVDATINGQDVRGGMQFVCSDLKASGK